MSIRYKFRSSINFDTLRLDGDKLTISIGELRWKIMCLKKLNDCPRKDFDLVLSDAVSGEEYNDDRFEIANGSSVIVKRVPAESVPSATFRYKKLEENKRRDNIRKGLDQHKPEKIVPKKLKPDSNKPIKLENMPSTNRMNPPSAGLPSEPKCHLCGIYYKKAVTTQCCYRNLCKKCIHYELVVKGICPLCSTKCGVEDLQPNVGLNRSVQHIGESHIFVNAPDQESGIQGKDLAAPITKRNVDAFNIASNMMKGSNRDMAESEYNSYDINQLLMMPQGYVHVQGGDQRFSTGCRNNKVDSRCYNCGSPDHLIRHCPIVLNPHHIFQAGHPMFQGVMPSHATPFWGGGAFPPVDPYMHMYGNQGMVPFGGSMAPITPYSLPYYLPTMDSNLPVPSGTMMGGLATPSGLRSELPVAHSENSENLELQHGESRRMSSDRNREHDSFNNEDSSSYKVCHTDKLQRSLRWNVCKERAKSQSISDRRHDHKLQREHRQVKDLDHAVRFVDKRRQKHSHSTTARKDRPYHNVDYKTKRNDEIRYRKHHRHSIKHHERQSGSDSRSNRRQIEKEKGV